MGRKLVLCLRLLLSFGALALFYRFAAPWIAAALPRPLRVTAGGVSAVAACLALLVSLWAVLDERKQRRTERTRDAAANSTASTLRETLRLYAEESGCPLVREVEDRALVGVSRAVQAPTGGRMDEAYAARAVDPRLDEALTTHSFVLVVGDSKAGKSRSAFEAVKRTFPDRHFVVPQDAESLRTLISRQVDLSDSVVWLDNLEEYLRAPAVDEATLSRLRLLEGVTVVATMRSVLHASFSPRAGVEPPEWRLLKSAETVRLQRLLTDAERRDARAVFHDQRLDDALGALGLAEYLSGAPDLLDYFEDSRDADPPVWALTSAAIDLIRCGLDPAPYDGILALAQKCLPASLPVDEEAWASALDRVEQPIYGTSSLVRKVGRGYKPFDYLLDHADTHKRGIAKAAWSVAREHGRGYELVSVGVAAMSRKEFKVAEATFRQTVDREAPGPATAGMYHLGLLALRTEHKAAARRWLERAHGRGFAPASTVLADLDKARKPTKALGLYKGAAERGFPPAAHNAGVLLTEAGDFAEAARYFEMAARTGDVDSANHLGHALSRLERLDESTTWFQVAADARFPRARHNLARNLLRQGKDRAAREELARAAEEGDASAGAHLGLLSLRAGDTEDAERWLRRAADDGDGDAMADLGMLLAERRRESTDAERWLRRAGETLDPGRSKVPFLTVRLARLVAADGRFAEAVTLCEPLARSGDASAALLVGRLYAMRLHGDQDGGPARAEEFFRIAADQQDPEGLWSMALFCIASGRDAEADSWLEKAAGLGHDPSRVLLKLLHGPYLPAAARRLIRTVLRRRLSRRRRSFEKHTWAHRLGPSGDGILVRLEDALSRAEEHSRRSSVDH